MKITKQNYEQFLIDFMDGKLNPALEESLFAFLDEHSDIKAEFEDLEIISAVADENISFDLKSSIKKPQITSTANINDKNYKEHFIASTEGDLTSNQETELDKFMRLNPALLKTQNLYKKSRLEADLSIQYPNKKALKKYPFYQRKSWIYSASAAASILLLLSIFFFSKSDKEIVQTQSAKLEDRISVPKKMDFIFARVISTISTENITPNFKVIEQVNLAILQEFSIPIEEIQKLQTNLNTKEQLATLRVKFKPTRFILQKDIDFMFAPIQNGELVNYAQNDEPGNNAIKSIWQGLFAKNKNRENDSKTDVKDPNKIGPLWVLANIGLERVNEVTGTNMRLNSKANREGKANNEKSEMELSRSAN